MTLDRFDQFTRMELTIIAVALRNYNDQVDSGWYTDEYCSRVALLSRQANTEAENAGISPGNDYIYLGDDS